MKRERSHGGSQGGAATTGTSHSWAEDDEEMVKTEAKRKFRLNDEDLKPLRARVLPNPHDANWAQMHLYRVVDLTARVRRARGARGVAVQHGARAQLSQRLCGPAAASSEVTLTQFCAVCRSLAAAAGAGGVRDQVRRARRPAGFRASAGGARRPSRCKEGRGAACNE
jgi:hypothetical protein